MDIPIILPKSYAEKEKVVEPRADRYNEDYVRGVVRKANERELMRLLFTSCDVRGKENVETITEKQTIIVAHHSSMSDYLLAGHFIADQITSDSRYFPRIIAGTNLYKGKFKRLWDNFGAISVDRTNKKTSYLRELNEFTAQLLRDGRNLMVYPEGGRNDGHELKPFRSILFGQALETILEDDSRDIQILPLNIEYDSNPDLRFIKSAWKLKSARDKLLVHAKEAHIEKNERTSQAYSSLASLLDYSYFGLDLASYGIRFAEGLFGLERRGKAHMYFGKPFSVREVKTEDKRELAEESYRRVKELMTQHRQVYGLAA